MCFASITVSSVVTLTKSVSAGSLGHHALRFPVTMISVALIPTATVSLPLPSSIQSGSLLSSDNWISNESARVFKSLVDGNVLLSVDIPVALLFVAIKLNIAIFQTVYDGNYTLYTM